MWRPDRENWERARDVMAKQCANDPLFYSTPVEQVYSGIFEAGADAMLGELKKQGSIMTPEQLKLIAPDRKFPYGWLVFIPEEK